MKVQEFPLDSIIPYARNPRRGPAIEKVASSIKEFGFRQPIVVDPERVIIAGHTRYEAAKRLGLKTAPVHVAEGLTRAQVKAYRIADNRVAQDAEWDYELLKLELSDLKSLEFGCEVTGFDVPELSELFGEHAEADSESNVRDEQKWLLMLEFDNERALERAYEEAKERGIPCKIID
jgi:ParB-like chromosome segregation protein Spo0J